MRSGGGEDLRRPVSKDRGRGGATKFQRMRRLVQATEAFLLHLYLYSDQGSRYVLRIEHSVPTHGCEAPPLWMRVGTWK